MAQSTITLLEIPVPFIKPEVFGGWLYIRPNTSDLSRPVPQGGDTVQLFKDNPIVNTNSDLPNPLPISVTGTVNNGNSIYSYPGDLIYEFRDMSDVLCYREVMTVSTETQPWPPVLKKLTMTADSGASVSYDPTQQPLDEDKVVSLKTLQLIDSDGTNVFYDPLNNNQQIYVNKYTRAVWVSIDLTHEPIIDLRSLNYIQPIHELHIIVRSADSKESTTLKVYTLLTSPFHVWRIYAYIYLQTSYWTPQLITGVSICNSNTEVLYTIPTTNITYMQDVFMNHYPSQNNFIARFNYALIPQNEGLLVLQGTINSNTMINVSKIYQQSIHIPNTSTNATSTTSRMVLTLQWQPLDIFYVHLYNGSSAILYINVFTNRLLINNNIQTQNIAIQVPASSDNIIVIHARSANTIVDSLSKPAAVDIPKIQIYSGTSITGLNLPIEALPSGYTPAVIPNTITIAATPLTYSMMTLQTYTSLYTGPLITYTCNNYESQNIIRVNDHYEFHHCDDCENPQQAEHSLVIQDSDGNKLLTYTPIKYFSTDTTPQVLTLPGASLAPYSVHTVSVTNPATNYVGVVWTFAEMPPVLTDLTLYLEFTLSDGNNNEYSFADHVPYNTATVVYKQIFDVTSSNFVTATFTWSGNGLTLSVYSLGAGTVEKPKITETITKFTEL